jgi:hypothetical protein
MMISEVEHGKFTPREGVLSQVKTQCHDVRNFLHYRFNLPKLESRKSESVSARERARSELLLIRNLAPTPDSMCLIYFSLQPSVTVYLQ